MSKILIYTISDLRDSSLKCVDLLYKSLLYKNKSQDFDFYVVTNNKNYQNIDSKDYTFLYDENKNSYVGWSKFNKCLPSGYDFYLYFDSDILVYESLEKIVSDTDFTLVFEDLFMSYIWFNYSLATEQEKSEFNGIKGINAGSFGFRDLDFLNQVRENCMRFDFNNQDEISQAIFEQSSFNYTLYKIMKNKKINDISSIVKLHATEEITNHTIYHFCGYDGHMNKKLDRMTKVNNKILNNG